MADRDGDAPSRSPEEAAIDGTAEDLTADPESLRAAVEAKYDFEDFGPADMAEMSLEEWEAVFDPEAWITGPELLDRVEAELGARVGAGELFAIVERHTADGDPRLLAYTDTGYALIHPDGSVEGDGTIRHEVEPLVALCSMPSFEVADPPDDAGLPDPRSVRPGTGNLGHRVLLAIASVQVIAGIVLLLSPIVVSLGPGSGVLSIVVGLGFLVVGLVLGVLVANARLSDRFRASEYRERLRAAGVGTDHRPSFLPDLDDNRPAKPPDRDGS